MRKMYIFKNRMTNKKVTVHERSQGEAQALLGHVWKPENIVYLQAVETSEYLSSERKYQ